MDLPYILNFISEIAYLLVVFGLFFLFAVLKGRQAIMNVTVGLYLALLISLEFPGYDTLFSNLSSIQAMAAAKLSFFLFITLFTTALFFRIMPEEFQEERFESIGKKLLLTTGATILVMIFSFHVTPIAELMSPGTKK